MAIRTKTIEYAFDTRLTDLVTATGFSGAGEHVFTVNAAALPIHIPENVSRTFRSVEAYVSFDDTTTAGANITGFRIGVQLAAVAFNDADTTATFTSTGENISLTVVRDLTSYFNTNFGSGVSQTCSIRFRATASAASNVRNIACKLVITYDYQDAAQATRVKTVRIPLDTNTAAIATTLTAVGGTNAIPALDTFLPEASKTYRQIFFEVQYADISSQVVTDVTVNFALDAEAASARAVRETAQQSSRGFLDFWVRNDMTTDAAHTFNASISLTTVRVCVTLVVTYTYDHDASTRVIQSLKLPIPLSSQISNSVADRARYPIRINVQEPGTLTLVQSAVRLYKRGGIAYNSLVRVGSQADRTYTHDNTVLSGLIAINHRFDAGAVGGASGVTLARGPNTFNLEVSQSLASTDRDINGFVILNYTSDKDALGEGVHNCTVTLNVVVSYAANLVATSAARALLPSTYRLNGAFFTAQFNNGANFLFFDMSFSRLGTDPVTLGFARAGVSFTTTDSEIAYNPVCLDVTPACRLWNNQPTTSQDRYDISQATRTYRANYNSAFQASIDANVTYHQFSYPITGTITGFSGDGSGILVEVIDVDTNEVVAETTSVIGGTYSTTVTDNTRMYYARAQQDATRVGSSIQATP